MPAVALRALRHFRGQRLAALRAGVGASPLSRADLPALSGVCQAARPSVAARGLVPLSHRCFAQQAGDQASTAQEQAGGSASSHADAAAENQESSTKAAGSGDATAQKKEPSAEAGKAGGVPVAEKAEAEAEEKESPEELLQKELDEAEAKMKKEKHELLLQLADFENEKKKRLVEREGRRRSAFVNCARKAVDVYAEFDQFAHTEDSVKDMSDAGKALQEGINLTRDLYRSTLEKFDVLPLVADLGQPLVAARHEEVGSVEAENLQANTIAEVVKPGWILDPQSAKPVVLKKAQVKVAKHGPATPPPPP